MPTDFPFVHDSVTPSIDLQYRDESGAPVGYFLYNGVVYTSQAAFNAAGGAPADGSGSISLAGLTPPYTVMVTGKAPTAYSATQNIAVAITDVSGLASNFAVLRYISSIPGSTLLIRRAAATQANLTYNTDALGADFAACFTVAANNARFSSRARVPLTDGTVLLNTMDRMFIGGANTVGAEWKGANNDGVIYRVTIWPGVLSDSRIRAIASGKRYGPTPVAVNGQAGGPGNVLSPGCIITGNYTYQGCLDAAGNQTMLVVETATKQFTGWGFVSSTIAKANQHCLPCSIITPGGKLFTAYANHPGGDTRVYFRRSTTTSPDDYAAESNVSAGVGNNVNYVSIHVHASTGNIFLLTQVFTGSHTGDCIGVFKSTDDGVSFTYLGLLVDSTALDKLFYWGAAWSGTDVLRVFPTLNYGDVHAYIQCIELNVVTGDIQSGTGSIGTLGSSPALQANCSVIWNVAGISTDRPVIYAGGAGILTQMIDDTTGDRYYWYGALPSGSTFTAANWIKTQIAFAQPASGDPNLPHTQFDSMGIVGGKPQAVFTMSPDGATWQGRTYLAGDANGTTWTPGKTVVSGGNFTTDAIQSVTPSLPATGALCFYSRGPFVNYQTWTTLIYWTLLQ